MVLVAVVAMVAGFGALIAFAPKSSGLAYAPVEVTGSLMGTVNVESMTSVQLAFTLKKPGFITLHEAVGDAPGPVIFTSPYMDEYSTSARFALTTPLLAGMSYVALLHVDNGDQTFVIAEDLPVMSNGAVVRQDFIAVVNTQTAE